MTRCCTEEPCPLCRLDVGNVYRLEYCGQEIKPGKKRKEQRSSCWKTTLMWDHISFEAAFSDTYPSCFSANEPVTEDRPSLMHDWDFRVFVVDINQRSLPTLLFHSCVCFCLYHGPFSCFSFYKFPWQLSVFLGCSSGLTSAVLVFSTICLFMKVSLSPYIIFCGWLGLKQKLTN